MVDTCQKLALSLNNKLYKQISIGELLGSVLANTIMTDCEEVIVDKLMKEKVIMFYTRSADDDLLIIKKRVINYVLN